MITLDTRTAARFAANLAHVAELKGALDSVSVAPVDGGLAFATTDRYRLLEYVVPGDTAGAVDTLVSAKRFQTELAHLAKVWDTVTISAEESGVMLTYGDGLRTLIERGCYSFPKYRELPLMYASPVPTGCLAFSPAVWDAIAKVKLADPKKDTWQATFTGEGKPVLLSAEDSGAAVKLALMPRVNRN